MPEIIITSFFTNGGNPITTLQPSIRIWEVQPGGQTLVVGEGESGGTDGEMVVMADDGYEDGFYKYTFGDVDGYEPTKSYVFRVDGGETQQKGERYQIGELDATDNVNAVVDAIYDEPRLEHIQAGSFGEAVNQDRANLQQLALDLTDVETLVNLLLKFETGRTKINGELAQLTVYDTDCVTPLRTFQLRDSSGAPSTDEICERVPISEGTTDGRGTCDSPPDESEGTIL